MVLANTGAVCSFVVEDLLHTFYNRYWKYEGRTDSQGKASTQMHAPSSGISPPFKPVPCQSVDRLGGRLGLSGRKMEFVCLQFCPMQK